MPMVSEKFSLVAIGKQEKLDMKSMKKLWRNYTKMEFMLLQLPQEMNLWIIYHIMKWRLSTFLHLGVCGGEFLNLLDE